MTTKKLRPIAVLCLMTSLTVACRKQKLQDKQFQGKVEGNQISVVSKVPGRVDSVYVQEGQWVKKGQLLMTLEFPEVEAKKGQAEGAVYAADAQYQMARRGATNNQLTQLNAKISALKEQLEFAEKSKNRLQSMLRDSLISQQTFDEVYAKYQGAESQYLAALAEKSDVENGVRIEQQNMALGPKECALGALKEVNTAEKEKQVVAPQNMTIESINLHKGELASPGYALVSGDIKDTTYFRFSIPEDKMKSVSLNKEVTIKVPYKDNMVLKGVITTIKPLPSYATISTAYPDFELQKTLYEIHVQPKDKKVAKDIITNANVSLELN